MFTTAAQLLDLTDILQSTIERIFVAPPTTQTPDAVAQPGLYADIPRGVFLVRGENVLLLGEIDLDKDDDPPPGYEKAEVELVHKLAKEKKARDAKKDKNRLKKLAELGFEGENSGEMLLG
ncbi:lsm domain-containing protein [Rutstroemia sp. NJR-2017a BBW]|nr:lsm domain-containing protein [Rutstroemia sp. NJR-2017a BBW]